MLPWGYISHAHGKDLIRGGKCAFVGHYDHHRLISTHHPFDIELYNRRISRHDVQQVKLYRESVFGGEVRKQVPLNTRPQ